MIKHMDGAYDSSILPLLTESWLYHDWLRDDPDLFFKIATFLISRGALLTEDDIEHEGPLHFWASRYSTRTFEYLIEHGMVPDINASHFVDSSEYTILSYNICKVGGDSVNSVINSPELNVNHITPTGRTALGSSVEHLDTSFSWDFRDAFHVLLDHQELDINGLHRMLDGFRCTPLHALLLLRPSGRRTDKEDFYKLLIIGLEQLLAHPHIRLETPAEDGSTALDGARRCPSEPVRRMIEEKYRTYNPEGVIEFLGDFDDGDDDNSEAVQNRWAKFAEVGKEDCEDIAEDDWGFTCNARSFK